MIVAMFDAFLLVTPKCVHDIPHVSTQQSHCTDTMVRDNLEGSKGWQAGGRGHPISDVIGHAAQPVLNSSLLVETMSGEHDPNWLGWHCGAYNGITEPKDNNTHNLDNKIVSHNHRFTNYERKSERMDEVVFLF
jgi:hypothetical protein